MRNCWKACATSTPSPPSSTAPAYCSSAGRPTADSAAMRQKFLDEHVHSDFEVRFFVEGRGLFFIHADDKVYAIMCERGDLLSVPANTPHWVDLGAEPELKCIRLFTTPEGWVANYTGSPIAKSFPQMEGFRERFR